MVKVIIAGSRELHLDTMWLDYKLDEFFPADDNLDGIEVVCGMARGIDLDAKNWAEKWKIPVKEFPADWEKCGKAAGIIRNRVMANYADMLIAIWDGKSKGTKNMIEEMLMRNKPVHVELMLK